MNFISHKTLNFSLLPGEVLFRRDTEASFFYLLLSGKILILQPFSATIVRQYGQGEIFGIPEVLLGEKAKLKMDKALKREEPIEQKQEL